VSPNLGSYTDVKAMVQELDIDYEDTTSDAHVLAYQIVYTGKKKNQELGKSVADLAAHITKIDLDHTRVGAPSLAITIQDPQWVILDSGFFTADDTGKLLDIDINYPDASRYWWRLNQFSPNGANREIVLTFLPRSVGRLMGQFGPVQVNRASKTRAEFLKMLCAKVPEIEFYSKELDIKQPIGQANTVYDTQKETSTRSSSKAPNKKAAKSKGLGANAATLTAKGVPLNKSQMHFATMILQIGESVSAPQAALEAVVLQGICESVLGEEVQWNPTYGGLLAGSVQNFGSLGSPGSDAVAQAEIKAAFSGGKGYQGAITLSQQYQNIGQLGVHNAGAWIGPGDWGPSGYGQYGQHNNMVQIIAEAQAIVAGGGGAGGAPGVTGTSKVAQPYYFQVKVNEDYWTAMCRLAQEVNWELVVDGDRIYYDTDQVFITQKPAAVIHRDDPTTLAWSYDWVNRQLATNFKIQVVTKNPFEFAAGEVVILHKFGVAAEASTAKLPGRWIIDEITRTKGDLFSEFTLVQPLPPNPEPLPTYVTPTGTGTAASLTDTSPKTPGAIYAAAQTLSNMKLPYVWGGGHVAGGASDKSPTGLDCSGSTSWVMYQAGFPLPGGSTAACVSGDFKPGAAGLIAGPGQYLTIYASGSHVFFRVNMGPGQDMQGNTVSPPVNMRGFDFFPWKTQGCGSDGGPSPGASFWTCHYPGT